MHLHPSDAMNKAGEVEMGFIPRDLVLRKVRPSHFYELLQLIHSEAGQSFVVASGRRTSSKSSLESLSELICFPVSSKAAVSLVRGAWKLGRRYQPEDLGLFLEALSRHPDTWCREFAAGQPHLPHETIRRLAADRSYDVCMALAQNADALCRMESGDVVELACRDRMFAQEIFKGLCQLLCQPAATCSTRAGIKASRLLKDLAEKVSASELLATEHYFSRSRNDESSAHKLFGEVFRGSDPYGGVGEYLYALCLTLPQSTDVDSSVPPLWLPVSVHGELVPFKCEDDLCRELLERLAASSSIRTKEQIAMSPCMTKNALELLKKENSFLIRSAILCNRKAVELLTDDEIRELLYSSPGVLQDWDECVMLNQRVQHLVMEDFERNLNSKFCGMPD